MSDSNKNNKGAPSREGSGAEKNGGQRIELGGGVYGVYMGETGKEQTAPRRKPQNRVQGAGGAQTPPQNRVQGAGGAQTPPQNRVQGVGGAQTPVFTGANRPAADGRRVTERGRYALSEAERQEIERRHAMARAKRRAAAEGRIKKRPDREAQRPTIKDGVASYVSYYLKYVTDRVYMAWMGVSIDLDTIIKSLIIAGMILLFAMLQTTVFSRFALFGATPDLMLGLVVAVGITEGERWGGATGLAGAFLIECLGGTGLTLLPLLYVPVGYVAGVLCTNYLRDSVIIRLIFTGCAGVLRAVVTAVYVAVTYEKADPLLVISSILIPEYFSTAVMSILPHVTEWFALKAFHKSREDKITS